MKPNNSLGNFFYDFFFGLSKFKDGFEFIQKHRLWKGFWTYGWLSRFMLLISLVIGFKFFMIFLRWLQQLQFNSPQALGASITGLMGDVFEEGSNLLYISSMKYVVLILVEVLIFHFVRKTAEILTGVQQDASFGAFVKAQMRMIKVAFYSWIMELVLTILIGIAVGIVGWDWLKQILVFIVQCFFLGFAMVDNYLERYHLGIDASRKIAQGVTGAVIAIGLVTYLLLLIPVAGPVLTPFLAGVTGTLLFYDFETRGVIKIPKPNVPVTSSVAASQNAEQST